MSGYPTGDLPDVGEHRYEGYSLEIKYGWMLRGSGADAVTGGRDVLDMLAAGFADSERTVRTALGGLGVSWSGGAAGSASAALAAVADWARDAGDGSADGGSRLREYGDSFARTKPRIAEAPAGGATFDAPAESDLAAVAGLQSDYRGGLAEYHRLDKQANDALYAYEAAGRAAVTAFPSPTVPPSVAAAAGDTAPRPRTHGPLPDDGSSPTTVPAAGGVARAGGAVPDPGPVGSARAGVDPGGVLSSSPTGPRWAVPEAPRAPAPVDGDGVLRAVDGSGLRRYPGAGAPSLLGPPGVGPFGARGSGYAPGGPARPPAGPPGAYPAPRRPSDRERPEQPPLPAEQPFAVDVDGVPPVLGLESADRPDHGVDGERW